MCKLKSIYGYFSSYANLLLMMMIMLECKEHVRLSKQWMYC